VVVANLLFNLPFKCLVSNITLLNIKIFVRFFQSDVISFCHVLMSLSESLGKLKFHYIKRVISIDLFKVNVLVMYVLIS
jgi:hypothetical protein